MAENEKGHGFMDKIKEGFSYVSQIVIASIFPPIAEGTEMLLKKIEERMMIIQKRMLRKLTSFLIIGIGGLLLVFSLLFFLIEYLGWSNAAAFFAIGITVFVIGLLLKAGGYDK